MTDRVDDRYPPRIDELEKKPVVKDSSEVIAGMFFVGFAGDKTTSPYKAYGETPEIALQRFNNKRSPAINKS